MSRPTSMRLNDCHGDPVGRGTGYSHYDQASLPHEAMPQCTAEPIMSDNKQHPPDLDSVCAAASTDVDVFF